jgi:2-amino-4-hydroxy-6-hydroxymethyldihydropteridine diphosphokinase
MSGIFLLLGSNLGDRRAYLEEAITLIGERCGAVTARSGVYRTAAWGKTDQPEFLNQAVAVDTIQTPYQLLSAILDIERAMGRERLEKWGTRVIDIDMLLYNDEIIRSRDLVIPHPQLENRRFALTPLVEIAGAALHPVLGKTMKELLAACRDELEVTSC